MRRARYRARVQAVREWAMRLWRETQEDGLFDAAAAVTFWVLLSLPALMLALLSSVSLLGDSLANELEEVTLDFVNRTFADESSDLQVRPTTVRLAQHLTGRCLVHRVARLRRADPRPRRRL